MARHRGQIVESIPRPMAQAKFGSRGCISSYGRRGEYKTGHLRSNSSTPVLRHFHSHLASPGNRETGESRALSRFGNDESTSRLLRRSRDGGLTPLSSEIC